MGPLYIWPQLAAPSPTLGILPLPIGTATVLHVKLCSGTEPKAPVIISPSLWEKGRKHSFCRESLMKSPKSDALPKAARPLHPGSPRSHKAELQSWGSAANPERGCHQSHRPTLEGAVTIQGCPLRAVVGPAWAPALQNWTLSRGREHPVVAVPCHQVPLPKHLHHTCCSSVNILQESPGHRKELGALPGIPHGSRARSRACPRPQAAHTPPLAPGVC